MPEASDLHVVRAVACATSRAWKTNKLIKINQVSVRFALPGRALTRQADALAKMHTRTLFTHTHTHTDTHEARRENRLHLVVCASPTTGKETLIDL